jgi:serine protease Do
MSSGIVSGIGRTAGLQDVTYENFIQTDAAVNPGNSGGPLTNTRGDVVGMTTAIATGRGNAVGQGQFAGIGLAIPISMIENVVDQLIERGEVQKGFLGVASVDMELVRRGMAQGEPLIRHAAQNFSGDGTVITLVSPGSPAERAGLQVGDVITQVDGRRVSGSGQLRALVAGRRPGESLPIDFWRPVLGREVPGQVQRVNVVIDRLEPEVASGGIAEGLRQLGFRELVTCTEDQALAHGVTFRRGVLVAQLDPASRVAREIPPGSVIVQAFGAPVNNLDDFYTRLEREMLRGQRMPQIPVTIVRPDGTMMPVVLSPRSTD